MATYKRHRKGKPKKQDAGIVRSELQSRWEQRILEAEQKKEAWKDEYRVEDLERAYYGHQRPEHWTSKDWFTLNLMFASVKVTKRNVIPKHIDVKMKLARSFITNPDEIQSLEQLVQLRQAVLRYMGKSIKLINESQIAYLNSLWQFGVVKVGYSAFMEDNPNAGSPLRDRNNAILYSEDGVPEMEPNEVVSSEEFFVDQVDPDCLLVDRYCENDVNKTGSWIAHKFYRSVFDIQNDPLYGKSKAIKGLGPSSLVEAESKKLDNGNNYRGMFTDKHSATLPENELCVGYEIYDLKNQQMLTVIRGASDIVLGPKPLPPGIKNHPFVFLKFNERRSEFYPIPVIFNWLGPQMEYNITRNQMAVHRKRFNRKYGYIQGYIDPLELDKLEDAPDGTFVKFNQAGAIEPIKDAPLDSAASIDTQLLRGEFMEISGVGTQQRGQTGAESATEADIVERRSREGEVDEHEEAMDFIGNVYEKLHSLIEANLTQEGAINLVGPSGSNWISFGPEHFDKIAGEVIFDVEAEVDTKNTVSVERAQLMELLNILSSNPMLALDDVILRAITSKFPSLADNELLIQRLQAMAQMAMQMQMAQVQAAAQGNDGKQQVKKK